MSAISNISTEGQYLHPSPSQFSRIAGMAVADSIPRQFTSPTGQDNAAATTFANYAPPENAQNNGQHAGLESISGTRSLISNTPPDRQHPSLKADPSPTIAGAASTAQIPPRTASINGMAVVKRIAKEWEKTGADPQDVSTIRNVAQWPNASPSSPEMHAILKVGDELKRTGEFDILRKQAINVARRTETWKKLLKKEATKQAGEDPTVIEAQEMIKLFGWTEERPKADKAALLYMMVIAQADTAEAQEERTNNISRTIDRLKMKEEARASFTRVRIMAQDGESLTMPGEGRIDTGQIRE